MTTTTSPRPANREPKPPWLKVKAPGGENYRHIKETLRGLQLHTVCEEARCPNVGECWAAGTATVMVLGDTCTRGCRFCAVTSGHPKMVVDHDEPRKVADAIAELGLRYVVLTMVDRDDLPDGGAAHVAETVERIHAARPGILVETLVGDFAEREVDLQTIIGAKPDVYAHNIEVPRRLTPTIRDRRCSYDRSLRVLQRAKELAPERFVKSSIMVGIGETDDELIECMRDLREVGVDVVTLGQYLRPTPKHAVVERYATPEQFELYRRAGEEMGFAFVASGPLVRSSYHAAEAFIAARGGQALPELAPRVASPATVDSTLVSAERLVRPRSS